MNDYPCILLPEPRTGPRYYLVSLVFGREIRREVDSPQHAEQVMQEALVSGQRVWEYRLETVWSQVFHTRYPDELEPAA